MIVCADVLTAAEVTAIRQEAARLAFEDGARTAGPAARQVKANAQAAASAGRDAILEKARRALLAHPVLAAAARPRRMSPLILSRYREGQTYGLHVDNALMADLRTDLSFTLFLSDPDSYDGGALELQDSYAPRAVRLVAGDAVLYASTTLHRVTPVTRGERLAIVGWIESWVRQADRREVLFDLDRALAGIPAGELADTLARTRSNLLRMWAGA